MRRAARQILIALLLVGVWSVSSQAQGSRPAGVVTTLSGEATVARAAGSPVLPLGFKADVYWRDRISTAQKSLVRVLLGGKAVVTVRELSILTLDDGPERATVSLFEGKIALGVLHSRMGPREAIAVHTPNAIAAVRGTIFLVEILPAQVAGDLPNTLITVARGVVGVTSLNVPGHPEVLVGPGQTYNVATGQLRTITAEQLAQGVADLQSASPHQRPPDEFQEAFWTQELSRTAAAGTPELRAPGVRGTGVEASFGDSVMSVITSMSNTLSGRGLGGFNQGLSAGGGTTAGVGCGGGWRRSRCGLLWQGPRRTLGQRSRRLSPACPARLRASR